MRSSAAQCRLAPPAVRGIESTSAVPLFHDSTARPSRSACLPAVAPRSSIGAEVGLPAVAPRSSIGAEVGRASAIMIAHGCGCWTSGDCGVPPRPGCRTNATWRPSPDHDGPASRDVDGARYRIGCDASVKMPMNPWSSRSDTKASERPSGDHAGASLVPRAKNACSASFDPSSGAIQMRRSLTKATRLPVGAIAGVSPSPSSFGAAAPLVAIDQTCMRGCTALPAGFGCRFPSALQFDP